LNLAGVSRLFGFQVSDCGRNPSERSFKCFLLLNLRRAEDKRFQLFEPEGAVLTRSGPSGFNGLAEAVHRVIVPWLASRGGKTEMASSDEEWHHISFRPSMAMDRVTASVYSISLPTGTPEAIRVTLIAKGLINSVR